MHDDALKRSSNDRVEVACFLCHIIKAPWSLAQHQDFGFWFTETAWRRGLYSVRWRTDKEPFLRLRNYYPFFPLFLWLTCGFFAYRFSHDVLRFLELRAGFLPHLCIFHRGAQFVIYNERVARFSYTAEKSDGEVYRGTALARDRFELYEIVRREGGRILALNEDHDDRIWSLGYWNAKFSTTPEYEKILFARNVGAMLSAGLSLARALAVIERETRNAKLRGIVADVASAVRRGETLHSALEKYPRIFPKLFSAMVRAGEEGGELPQSLIVVADQMERMYTLKKKIRGAMLYPCIIVLAIIGIGTFMMINVVPTLAQTFKEMGAQLPASTRAIIALSDFLVQYTIAAFLMLIASVGVLYASFKSEIGRKVKDFVFLHLPIIGKIVKEVNAARTARTLASLLSSGVDVISSLDITKDVVQNSYFKKVISDAKDGVVKGEPLSSAFVRAEHLYPAFVGEMMSVGEETGQTTEMMKKLALFYEDEVDRKTKDMSTIIEPFLMLVIGASVGFFAVAMISPIYQLSDNI